MIPIVWKETKLPSSTKARMDFAAKQYRQDYDAYVAEAWVGKARVGRIEVVCTRTSDWAYLHQQMWAAPRKTAAKRGSSNVSSHQDFLDAVQGAKDQVEKAYASFIKDMGYA